MRVNSCSAVLPSVGLRFMASFCHIWFVSVDPSETMGALWVTFAELMIVASFPIDFFGIWKTASRWGYAIWSQKSLAARNFLLGICVGNDKFLIERSLHQGRAVGGRILSLVDSVADNGHLSCMNLMPKSLAVEDSSKMPVAERNLFRVIIDLEMRRRHA